jgi:NodT family efflux transporter outer membrane factor (OMF) lipoprotein
MAASAEPGADTALLRGPAAFAAVLLLTLSTGCTLGPDYQAPAPPSAVRFTRSEAVDVPINAPPTSMAIDASRTDPLAREWWRSYGSDHIDELVQRTLQHNPDIAAGLANLRQAQENVRAQQGLFYPQVDAGYGDSRQRTGKILQSSLNSGNSVFNLHTAQLNVSLVPDVFGANARQVESLEAVAANNAHQLDALRLTLVTNVVSAGLQEQLLIELRQLALQSVEVSHKLTEQARVLDRSGYTGALDLAVQESADASIAALLPPIEKQLEQTRDLIAILCGDLPGDAQIAAAAEPLKGPGQWPRVVPSSLVEHRPDIQAAADTLHAANAQIGVAKAARFPQLSLTGDLAFTNTMLAGLLSASSTQIGTIADSVSLPLFAGGSLAARQRAAVAATEAAQAQYQSVVLAAFQNVADTLYALDQDGRAMKAALDASDAAQRQYQITRRQAEAGYVATPVLLAAELNDLQTKIIALQDRGAYLLDTVALYQAVGGGWQSTEPVETGQK